MGRRDYERSGDQETSTDQVYLRHISEATEDLTAALVTELRLLRQTMAAGALLADLAATSGGSYSKQEYEDRLRCLDLLRYQVKPEQKMAAAQTLVDAAKEIEERSRG